MLNKISEVIYDSFLGTGGGVFFLESNSCRIFLETETVALSDVAAAASKAASLRLSMPITISLLSLPSSMLAMPWTMALVREALMMRWWRRSLT